MDAFCNKVMRIMLIEQFNNDDVRKLYQEWLLDKPLNFQSKIFSALISMGVIPNGDSKYLAIKYYSPIYFMHKMAVQRRTDRRKQSGFCAVAYKHIQLFFMEIGGNNG